MKLHMRVLRWTVIGLLLFVLFTGVAYVLTPMLTDGWGNSFSSVVGVLLAVLSLGALWAVDRWEALPWVQAPDDRTASE